MEWQPIETAPIKPFDKDKWFMAHSPRVLLFAALERIGTYSYTERGKGRWKDSTGSVIEPTHWMPLPKPPKEYTNA